MVHLVDTAFMNFALNQFMDDELSLRTLFATVQLILKPGGIFTGIALDGDRILANLHSFQSSCATIEPLWNHDLIDTNTFGNAYRFQMATSYFDDVRGGEPVLEYLLRKTGIEDLAAEYGLRLVKWYHPADNDETLNDPAPLLNVIFKFIMDSKPSNVVSLTNGLEHGKKFDASLYFPPSPPSSIFLMSQEGLYSSSRSYGARRLVEIVRPHLIEASQKKQSECIIIDGTACCGTDSLFLAISFPNSLVIAVEKDTKNSTALIHNASRFSLKNLKTVGGTDVIEHVKALSNTFRGFLIDIFYIDVPWGGIEYKTQDKVKLRLNDISLGEVVKMLYKFVGTFLFKVPNNYDHEDLMLGVKDLKTDITIYNYRYRNVIKFKFVTMVVL
jgi:predicted RNA methylase